MSNRTPAEVFPAGEFIRDELEERGWTQSDLAKITGRPLSAINLIITGRKAITPETATELGSAFGTSAEFWLNLETAYRLSKVTATDETIRHRARIFELAPINEMEKRNWIRECDSPEETESELKKFYEIDSLDKIPELRLAARTSVQTGSKLMPEHLAWGMRALHLARGIPAPKYTNTALEAGIRQLRTLAAFPEETRKVSEVLRKMGIRFVIVEHLQKTKIDGAALWDGEDWDKPVIALSLRYDRIDSFWHTLFHELSHIKNHDSYVDVDIVRADRCLSNEELSEIEKRANDEAADMLIRKETLQSFILRTRPFYSKTKIIQFANRIHVHPGIIAGQLQHRGEIDWAANREMLVKVRDIVISGSITDGWGVRISK